NALNDLKASKKSAKDILRFFLQANGIDFTKLSADLQKIQDGADSFHDFDWSKFASDLHDGIKQALLANPDADTKKILGDIDANVDALRDNANKVKAVVTSFRDQANSLSPTLIAPHANNDPVDALVLLLQGASAAAK